jgi:tetratricopeptide (TPR) repeat protein
LVEERVFRPLKMTSSSLVWQGAYDHSAATGHDEFSEVREKFRPEEPNAAASLHTTAQDFARFLGEMLVPTRLQGKTVQAMLTPEVAVETDQPLHWGLGWGLEGKSAPYAFWHWGDNGSFRCLTVGVPAGDDLPEGQGRAFVYFTNSFNGLAVASAMTEILLGEGTAYALTDWIGYDAYDAPVFRLRRDFLHTALEGGAPAAERFLARVRKEWGDEALEERAVNNLGYTLLGRDEANAQEAALVLFRLNVELYPDSWNVYDSLAEGYHRTGNGERAIHFYRESLKRNPDNDNGKRMLEEIQREESRQGTQNKSEG